MYAGTFDKVIYMYNVVFSTRLCYLPLSLLENLRKISVLLDFLPNSYRINNQRFIEQKTVLTRCL